MAFDTFSVSQTPALFRVAYVSRARKSMAPFEIAQIVAKASKRNIERHVSGVLLYGDGVFLQWLEGPASDVWKLMADISVDPRHRDVKILEARQIKERRFARWPMHLDSHVLPPASFVAAELTGHTLPALVEAALDDLDAEYDRDAVRTHGASLCDLSFLNALRTPLADRPAMFPEAALDSLRTRAELVDETCRTMARGWEEDTWSEFEIMIGLTQLNGLWQKTDRALDPLGASRALNIVVPANSSEVLTATVKTDLFRTAGVSVHVLFEQDSEKLSAALGQDDRTPVLVAGPRVGLGDSAAQAEALAERLQKRFQWRAVHLGGRTSGPLATWPERLALRPANADRVEQRAAQWLGRAALEAISGAQRTP